MNHLQLPVPEFRRKGFSLLGHAFALFLKNAFPILIFVAIMAVPIETIKNYYYFEYGNDSSFFSPMDRMDNIIGLFFLSAVTPMVVHYILGQMTAAHAGIKPSLLWGLRKWLHMMMYGFLQNVIIIAGIVMLVVPGLIFAVWLMLMPVFVSIEDTSQSNPLQACREMARGRFFKFAGYALGVYSAISVLSLLAIFISESVPGQSWITATIMDVWLDWLSQLLTIVLLLVYLQVKTETNEMPPDSADEVE